MRSVALFIMLLVSPLPAKAAGGLAYLRASSQLDAAADRGRYHPLNLLDEDAATIWCEGDAGLGEGQGITIYFKKKQRIDRMLLVPAESSGRLVTRVKVNDGQNTINVELEGAPVEQVLRRPLEGTTFEITIERVGGPNKGAAHPEDVACLADAVLYMGKLPWGKAPEDKPRYDDKLDKLLGRWNGGPLGAPDKELVFALDGTWEWSFKPLLGGRPKKSTGEYRFRGNRLLMREGEAGRWSDMQWKVERVRIDPDEIGAPLGDYDRIKLGTALGDEMAGDYTNAAF